MATKRKTGKETTEITAITVEESIKSLPLKN